MKVQKASYWIHNQTDKAIRLEQFGIKIQPRSSADLFVLNPRIIYKDLIQAESKGMLSHKLAIKELIKLDGKPAIQLQDEAPKYTESKLPLNLRVRSTVGIKKKDRDYIAEMEAEFAASTSEADILKVEKQKMLERLRDMKQTNIGENGEVFSDDMFTDLDI